MSEKIMKYIKKNRGFINNLIESMIGNTISKVLLLLLPILAVKLYGTEVYGSFIYGFSITTIASIIACMGLDMGLLYYIPKANNRYNSGVFLLVVIVSIILGSIINIFIIGYGYFIPILCFLALEKLFYSLDRSNNKVKQFFYLIILLKYGVALILLPLCLRFEPINGILMSYTIGMFFFVIGSSFINKDNFSKIIIDKKVIMYSIPLMVTSTLAIIMNQIDVIMIGYHLSKVHVGVYSIVALISTLPSYLLLVFNTVFAPKISKMYNNGEVYELKKMYVNSARILGFFSICIIVFLIMFDDLILGILGQEFLIGKQVLLYRGIGEIVNSFVGSVGLLLAMCGKPKLNMYTSIIATSVNVLLNYLLIPMYGLNGAAFASMVAIILSNVIGYIYVKKYFKIRLFGFL